MYSEITGYAVTCYSWIYSELGRPEVLRAAKDAAQWVIRNMNSEFLLVTGYKKQASFAQKGELSNQIYLFDNGMVMIGLLNLYKITGRQDMLRFAMMMADSLLKYFFDGTIITHALLDRRYEPLNLNDEKWSTLPGVYHSKLSLGFLELSNLSDNRSYAKISDHICEFAISLQRSDGSFETYPHSQITHLHPHLYACEGLIYSGISQSNEKFLRSGLQGIIWATGQLNARGGLPRDNSGASAEQSDAMCQLLRLLTLCYTELNEFMAQSEIKRYIDLLHNRILDFCITSSDGNRGGLRYQLELETTCSWCTMFCMQALRLWEKWKCGQINDDVKRMDFFV